MSVYVPTNLTLPFWTQSTTLDGVSYLLSFFYNQREDVYYMTIADTTGATLCGGVKLISNWPLLSGFIDPHMPPGELIAMALGTDQSPAGLGELGIGQRVQLTYFTQAEVQASGLEVWRSAIPEVLL